MAAGLFKIVIRTLKFKKMKTTNPVVWFEIYVDNLPRAKKFYETVLDLQLSELPNPTGDTSQMLAFPMDMETKNMASGALVKMDGFKAGGNSTLVYFFSEDCSKEEARIEKAGGRVINPKMSIGEYGFVSLGQDTEGNLFGIHSMK
jgi:predicted enzyme related to lactoylglutathione lyase